MNQETGRSKGYAFFEFTNYKEFSDALNLKGIIFGKQQLVLNSAKNKFAYNEEEKINKLISLQNITDEKKSLNSSLLSSQTQPLSTDETRVSSTRNSKEFLNTNNNSNLNNRSNPEDRINPDINGNGFNDELQLQIKNSLKKLSEQYYQYDNKPSLFNYYCSPFVYNHQNRSNFYFVNNEENTNANYQHNLYIKCPFESCKEK